jgi:hypothetical protein
MTTPTSETALFTTAPMAKDGHNQSLVGVGFRGELLKSSPDVPARFLFPNN